MNRYSSEKDDASSHQQKPETEPDVSSYCVICPSAPRGSRFCARSTLSAPLDCCRDICTHRTQVAESISVRVGSVFLLSPLRFLQDMCHRVPLLGHLVDCVASLTERIFLSLALNIWLSAATVCPRLLYELCICQEPPFSAIVQIFGVLIVQPVVEIFFAVFGTLREVACLLLLMRSQRVLAQTFLCPSHNGNEAESIENYARVFVNCDKEYERDNCQSFFLGFSWKAAHLATTRDRFTHLVRATTWSNAFDQLAEIAKSGQQIAEVQFAGHGCAGCAWIGSDCFNEITTSQNSSFRNFVASRPFPVSAVVRPLFWFRTCSTLNKDVGRRFAKALSDAFKSEEHGDPKLRVAGHTQVIAQPNPLLQPGLVCFDPVSSAAPQWQDDEGPMIGSLTFSPAELMPIYTV